MTSHWSDSAKFIFTNKYLHPIDEGKIENALRRVADVAGYRDGIEDALFSGMCAQRFAFNSPVFFNAGVVPQPQCSACFIQGVEDELESILDLALNEGMLFKYGSGTGTNLSNIRSKREELAGGGVPSGPVSFMRIYDAVAGIVKSGGKTRRAAKMQILDTDHPDIEEFIWCKAREENKARILVEKAGYDSSFDGEAYNAIAFQNANLSVRVTDDFMLSVTEDAPWLLTARTTGDVVETISARTLFRQIAAAAWECGDPGIQFADTINSWHTCPGDGEIVASNPCSEYLFLNETSCNLASLNLVKYLTPDGRFDVLAFEADVRLLARAMDSLIDVAGYPTQEIGHQTCEYRTLGIGFTNLGGLLAILAIPYNAPEARSLAASITAVMHFAAYHESALMAAEYGPYPRFMFNAETHRSVLRRHAQSTGDIIPFQCSEHVLAHARMLAVTAIQVAKTNDLRNAQVTALAPTGTISFIMDAITTGIEPLFSRDMVKNLVGGGSLNMTCALEHVMTADEVSPEDHLRMVAACQPFISGGISKTINMPRTVSTEDIENIYMMAHALGLKSVSVYRDRCKVHQPHVHRSTTTAVPVTANAMRQPLPVTRSAVTHRFSVAGQDGYLTVGMYPDGRPGEIFVQVSKEGSTISGLLDSWAITVSIALQYGVPLTAIMNKLAFVRFEPAGVTGDPDVPIAHSIIDFIARWLLVHFNDEDVTESDAAIVEEADGCPDCGELMIRTGTCMSCPNCGHNGGCG